MYEICMHRIYIKICVVGVDKNRTISHSKGSHGVPGIFVKYDLSSLRVHIRESHQPFWQFVVRLCGIVGGIFATSGTLHIQLFVWCRLSVKTPDIWMRDVFENELMSTLVFMCL